MARKKTAFSNNPKTISRMMEWRRQWAVFDEVQAAGALTADTLKRKEQELEYEGKQIAQALIEDSRQGKLTRYGAHHIAKTAKNYNTTAKDGSITTHHTYAVANGVRGIAVTGIRREEIHYGKLTKVYRMQAERKIKERRKIAKATHS